jgi:hypothetical protein
MSVNCIECAVEERTGGDLLCDGCRAAHGNTLRPVVGRAPGEFEARAIEEGLRNETIGVYGIGAKKRMAYCETLWPEWVAEKRKQVRLELLGEESNKPGERPETRSEDA